MFSRSKVAMIAAEVMGTAVLTYIILAVSRSPIGLPYFVAIAVGITLSLLVLTVGSVSGAHVNPAVTLGLWSIRKISTIKAILFVAAQFLGAVLAWRLYTYFTDAPLSDIAGTFEWRILIAEAVGTFVFGFGIAAAIYQKYEGGKLALTIGASLMLGILIAATVSNGVLNPAAALGVQSWGKAYIAGPIIGSVVGMNLYALLFAPAGSLVLPRKSPIKVAATARNTKTKKTTRKKK